MWDLLIVQTYFQNWLEMVADAALWLSMYCVGHYQMYFKIKKKCTDHLPILKSLELFMVVISVDLPAENPPLRGWCALIYLASIMYVCLFRNLLSSCTHKGHWSLVTQNAFIVV